MPSVSSDTLILTPAVMPLRCATCQGTERNKGGLLERPTLTLMEIATLSPRRTASAKAVTYHKLYAMPRWLLKGMNYVS